MLILLFSFSSVWNSYKGLSQGAALGCLLLWEANLWRSGTSSRFVCVLVEPIMPLLPKCHMYMPTVASVWPADAA